MTKWTYEEGIQKKILDDEVGILLRSLWRMFSVFRSVLTACSPWILGRKSFLANDIAWSTLRLISDISANCKLFLDFLGFFLKALGKHWKWPDSSRNAKKKNSLLCGGVVPCTVQYRTVQNCTVQQQTLVWKYFFCNSGWIRTYALVSRCFWLT